MKIKFKKKNTLLLLYITNQWLMTTVFSSSLCRCLSYSLSIYSNRVVLQSDLTSSYLSFLWSISLISRLLIMIILFAYNIQHTFSIYSPNYTTLRIFVSLNLNMCVCVIFFCSPLQFLNEMKQLHNELASPRTISCNNNYSI